MIISKYYVTLADAVAKFVGGGNYLKPYKMTNLFASICEALQITINSNVPFTINDGKIRQLFDEIYALYGDEYIYICDDVEDSNNFVKFMYKVISIMSRTYDYYNTLISAYDNEKATLLADLKSNTRTTIKYNDTPQNAQTFDDEAHLSNITNTEAETIAPQSAPIDKLKNIQDKYNMLYNDWCKYFARLFIENQDMED